MLRLAALPLPIDHAEVDFDRMADRRVSVGRHLHKQHALQDGGEFLSETQRLHDGAAFLLGRWDTHRLALVFVHRCFHFPDLLPV